MPFRPFDLDPHARIALPAKARILMGMDPLAPIINRLHDEGRPRVWSIVITVMGDSVHHRGGQIATGRLARLLGRIGIESGAMRTALSRLANDGWVTGTRSGRTSSYQLSDAGQEQVVPAAARIYAPPHDGPVHHWVFDTNPASTGIAIAGGYLRPVTEPSQPRTSRSSAPSGFAIVGHLPPQAHAAVAEALPETQTDALTHLWADLADLHRLHPIALAPLDALAARTLLIHRWRRIALRWCDLPPETLPPPFTGRNLRAEVARAYAHLTPQAERWLSTKQDDLAPLPAPDPGFANRFNADALDLAGQPRNS